jgi:hypothetical protein
MVQHKAGAVRAGLDEGEDDCHPDDFLHLDTILGRFVEDVAQRLGLDLRKEATCA